jgi:hypothetical protein
MLRTRAETQTREFTDHSGTFYFMLKPVFAEKIGFTNKNRTIQPSPSLGFQSFKYAYDTD